MNFFRWNIKILPFENWYLVSDIMVFYPESRLFGTFRMRIQVPPRKKLPEYIFSINEKLPVTCLHLIHDKYLVHSGQDLQELCLHPTFSRNKGKWYPSHSKAVYPFLDKGQQFYSNVQERAIFWYFFFKKILFSLLNRIFKPFWWIF